jgi:hypothetical protein
VERAFRPDAGDLDAKLAELLIEGEDPDDDGGDDDDPAEMRPAAEGVNGADSFPEPALEPEEPDRPPLARKPEVDEVAEA